MSRLEPAGVLARVGWLGLGAMGVPMARRLAEAGHRLSAYDPNPERASALGPDVGAAASPMWAADGCEVLVVMVATPAQAEVALFGPAGAAAALRPDTRVVLLATFGPAWVRGLTSRLPSGVRVVDAPVSGGVGRAHDGTLLIMASAAEAADLRLLSVLGEVVVVGEQPGDGQAMKMVNQVLCGVHIAAAAEALALAESMGIDPELAWRTVRRGAAASFMLDDRGARMVSGEFEPVRSSMSLFVKDLHLVLDEAQAARLPTAVVAAAAELFSAAAAQGRSAQDDSELYDFVRSLRRG